VAISDSKKARPCEQAYVSLKRKYKCNYSICVPLLKEHRHIIVKHQAKKYHEKSKFKLHAARISVGIAFHA
jgi:hypothetical protein